MTSGLVLTKPDIRNYSHSRSFGSVGYSREGLNRKPLAVYDQEDTQFCTGFSMAGALSFKLGFSVSPEFVVAKEGEVNLSPILGGTTMDTAPKAVTTFGVIPQKDCPYSLAKDGQVKVATWSNYPSTLDQEAKQYIQGAYYMAHTGSGDAFDNIMSTIYLAHQQGEEVAVQMGTAWYDEFNFAASQKIPVPVPSHKPSSEHAWVIFDWDGDNAYALLSQGESFGSQGILTFPRAVINFLFQDSYATTRVMRDRSLADGSYKAQLYQYLLQAVYQLKQILHLS